MVDLKAKPYFLSDEDIAWVESTIAGMTDEEKVGQLFFQLAASQEESYLKELMEKYHLGGCRYNGMPGIKVLEQNRTLQKYAKIPVIIACNPEQGGNGVCPDGTFVGSGIKVGATGKTLVITAEKDELVIKSARNIPGVVITMATILNPYMVLNNTMLVVDKAALEKIEEVYA